MIRKKYSKKEITLAVITGLFVVSILTFYIWHQMESVRIGYEISKLEEKVTSLREEIKKLEAKKSSLLALRRIEKIAKEELKLTPAEENQIIYDDYIPHP